MSTPATTSLVPASTTDDQLISLWLAGRPPSTVRTYRREAMAFVRDVGAIRSLTLGQLVAWSESLSAYKEATRQRKLATIKSLLSFAVTTGYHRFNPGTLLRMKRAPRLLGSRILAEEEVHRMLALTTNARDALLLRVLYVGGLRVSEVVSLRWSDVRTDADGAVLRIIGKGNLERYVRVSATTASLLEARRRDDDMPVFGSLRSGRPLDTSSVWRVVRCAARRANIASASKVSPHWLRHAHASHALARGASLVLVRDTLGHANVATTSLYLHANPGESSGLYLDL